MSALTIEALGLTQEELAERVVNRAVEQLMTSVGTDEDGHECPLDSDFQRQMKRRIQERIDQAVDEIAAKNVLPNVASYVEGLCLQETNKWGGKIGEPISFIEYLIKRAENYLTEPVNYEGKTKLEAGSFSWSGTQTRVSHLVHKHLHYGVAKAMTEAVKNANAVIVGGLEQTVRIKLQEVAAALKVEVKTK